MSENYSDENRGGASTPSWWKHILVICIGIIIALVAIFGIKAIMAGSHVKSESPKSAETISTPAPDGSTPDSSTTETSPEKPKTPAKIALTKEFCSEPNGICLNYPENLKVDVEAEFSGMIDSPWASYSAKFKNRAGKTVMELDDAMDGIGLVCPEDDDTRDTFYVLDAAPTKLTITYSTGDTMKVYAVKVVKENKQENGSLEFSAGMHLTGIQELAQPGKVRLICELGFPSLLPVKGRHASVHLGGLEPLFPDYDSYDEAAKELQDPKYQEVWETLKSAHNK